MKIWITRHGQTELNKQKLMQGQLDIPLNETGIAQAKHMKERLKDIHFDAVYVSPLTRAKQTASIISGLDESQLIIEERIIEVDFGRFERAPYNRLGLPMTLYWSFPEVFPAPKTVETVASMVDRTSSFLKELEQKDYDNVLLVCHGGIMRALSGYLTDKKNGLMWRPRPTNCEVRVFESLNGTHRMVDDIKEF